MRDSNVFINVEKKQVQKVSERQTKRININSNVIIELSDKTEIEIAYSNIIISKGAGKVFVVHHRDELVASVIGEASVVPPK